MVIPTCSLNLLVWQRMFLVFSRLFLTSWTFLGLKNMKNWEIYVICNTRTKSKILKCCGKYYVIDCNFCRKITQNTGKLLELIFNNYQQNLNFIVDFSLFSTIILNIMPKSNPNACNFYEMNTITCILNKVYLS